jgi:hypothetical protein
MTALPSGTVTFLFADIAGSTRLWQEYPDEMRERLAPHDEILRTDRVPRRLRRQDGASSAASRAPYVRAIPD